MQPQRTPFIMSGRNQICDCSRQAKLIDPFGSRKRLSIEKETSRQREFPFGGGGGEGVTLNSHAHEIPIKLNQYIGK